MAYLHAKKSNFTCIDHGNNMKGLKYTVLFDSAGVNMTFVTVE